MKHNYYLRIGALGILLTFSFLLTAQTPGTPDPTFGQGGQVLLQNQLNYYYGGHTALQPDGKFLVAGTEIDNNTNKTIVSVIRLMPNGALDPTYGNNGLVHPAISLGEGDVYNIALDAAGKLILAGDIITGSSNAAFAARLDANGTLDTSFGQNGLAIFDVGNDEDNFSGLLIKPNGSILLGGHTYDTASPNIYDLLLVQLLPDGTPDPDFGTAGIATADFAKGLESILSLALQADGKIVASGGHIVSDYNMELVRFLPNGMVDQSFGTNGAFIYGLPVRNEVTYSVAVQADQKIVFCGAIVQGNSYPGEVTLFRLLPNGTFDPSFGTGGRVTTDLGQLEFARSLAIQSDGKIVLGAESSDFSTGGGWFWVLRYNTNGTPDLTFGDNGKVQSPLYENSPETADIFLQPDGKIVHTGTDGESLVLWRYASGLMVDVPELAGTDFKLQCLPNVVTQSANLTWELPNAGTVHCDLYDLSGRLICPLIPPTFLVAGRHAQKLDFGAGAASGQYCLVFYVDGERQVIRMVKN